MNIAILSREYPPDTEWGGCASANLTLATTLAQMGHSVSVICQAVGHQKETLEDGVHVFRVGTNPRRYSARARVNFYFFAWKKLLQVARKQRIDVIQADYWSAEGLFPALWRKAPLVITAQSTPQDVLETKSYSGALQFWQLKALKFVADLALRRASKVIPNSRENLARLRRQIGVDIIEKTELVPLSVDPGFFRPGPPISKAALGIASNSPVILTVGRLEPRKGTQILLDAVPKVLSRFPGAKFILVGRDTPTGPDGRSFKGHLDALASQGGFAENLVWVPHLSREELVRYYRCCDLFVLPSLEESFGLVILEAMACGKPVVVTATGIVPELDLKPPRGMMVPCGDAPALAEAIIQMLSVTGIGQVVYENRTIVERKFSPQVEAQKMLAIYESLLNRPASDPLGQPL